MAFINGSYVQISSSYPFGSGLEGQTGDVIAQPDDQHPGEYLIKLDSGMIGNSPLEGKQVWVESQWLELASKKPRRPKKMSRKA
jgi:hypothetical protein